MLIAGWILTTADASDYVAKARVDSGVLHAEIVGELPASAESLWAALSVPGAQHAWVPYMRQAKVISTPGSPTTCAGVTSLPWPLKDRTWTVEMTAKREGERYVASWQYVPGSGNLRDTSGTWTLEPVGADRTRVHLVAVADVRPLLIPGLLTRWAQEKGLPAMFDALYAQRRPVTAPAE